MIAGRRPGNKSVAALAWIVLLAASLGIEVAQAKPVTPAAGAGATSQPAADTNASVQIEGLPKDAEVLANYPGICLDLGCGDGKLAAEIAQKTRFTVFAIARDDADCAKARQTLDQANLYGTHATAVTGSLKTIPLPNGYGNLVVTANYADELDLKEVIRVLNPNGLAIIGGGGADAGTLKAAIEAAGLKEFKMSGNWAIFRGKMPAGVDDWTHYAHGPDNNRTCRETAVRPPFRTQWVADGVRRDNFWCSTLAVANGRMIHYAIGGDRYYAWDCFNGTMLWERTKAVPGNVARYALVDGVYYAPEGERIVALDAATGRELRAYQAPGSGGWLWLAVQDGTLYGLSRGSLNWKSPFGEVFHAIDLKDGKVLWTHPSRLPVDMRSACLAGGAVLACNLSIHGQPATQGDVDHWSGTISGDCTAFALDAKTGQEKWQSPPFPWITAGALWIKWHATGAYAEGRYFLWASGTTVRAFDPKTGQIIKEYPKSTSGGPNGGPEGGDLSQPLFLDGKLVHTVGPVYKCEDLASGEPAGTMPKVGCGPGTASTNCLFSGGQSFSVYDLQAKRNWDFGRMMRTPCIEGPYVADGLVFNIPSRCGCPYLITLPVALAPAGPDWTPPNADKDIAARLVAGPAVAVPLTGDVKDDTPGIPPKTPAGARLTATTSADELTFAGSQEGIVWAGDARTGGIRWKFLCGAAVRTAPAFSRGRLFVGSDDGNVYCLDARTGQLAWRFRAAPEDRYFNMQGQLISSWPVRTGIAVDGDIAYCGAGLFPYDGTYLYAMDVKTGRSVWARRIGDMDHLGGIPQAAISIAGDKLIIGPVTGLGRKPEPTEYSKADGQMLTPSKKR